jgi:hypothetical protein
MPQPDTIPCSGQNSNPIIRINISHCFSLVVLRPIYSDLPELIFARLTCRQGVKMGRQLGLQLFVGVPVINDGPSRRALFCSNVRNGSITALAGR